MNKETIVCGVQQVGVGVFDVVEAYNWYIKAFGCDIMVTDAKESPKGCCPTPAASRARAVRCSR